MICAKCVQRRGVQKGKKRVQSAWPINGNGFTEEGVASSCKLASLVRLQKKFLDFLIKTHPTLTTTVRNSDTGAMAKILTWRNG